MAKTNKIMKKNIIIILLSLYGIVVSCELFTMSNTAAVLLKECKAASNVINQVYIDDSIYFMNVLIETEVWDKYQSLIPFDYYEDY